MGAIQFARWREQVAGELQCIRHLEAFYDKWKNEPLVVDKWLAVQSTTRLPSALADVKRLMTHPAFNIRNPNKVYALIGGFRGNLVRFHAADGSGGGIKTRAHINAE